MEKRVELPQEGHAAQNDRRADKRRREEEVETGKLTISMKQRLREQRHREEALQTENSELQFNLSTANTKIKQLKAMQHPVTQPGLGQVKALDGEERKEDLGGEKERKGDRGERRREGREY